MRTYRGLWGTVTAVLLTAALAAAGLSIGWYAVLATVAGMSAVGAVTGFALVEDPRGRPRAIAVLAFWCGAGGVFIVGLPPLFGPWSLLVLVAVGGLCPAAVLATTRDRRYRRPVRTIDQLQRLSESDMERRWLRTSQDLRDRRSDTPAVLALVEERSILLDELERRDPQGFAALLVRAGWRDPQDR